MSRGAERDALIGRLLMVGVRGASAEDPSLRADIDACRAARCRAVILFDVDLPALTERTARGEPRGTAIAHAPRNMLSPAQTRELTRHLSGALGPGTIIAVDQEGGEVARLHQRRGFACTLSADAFSALDEPGRRAEAAAQARIVADAGCTLNLAPCVDLALNPENPIIAGKRRAFAVDPRRAAACAAHVIGAHASLGLAACLKHFPGHGSSAGDSHLGFTDITETHSRHVELEPYRTLVSRFAGGPLAVMTGHLHHRDIDPDHPASLSRAHTTGVLRERLGFRGPVIVDSLDMGAVTSRYDPAEALVLAINAGADVLLDCNNAPGPWRTCPASMMAESVAKALADGRITGGVDRLRESAARIDAALAPRG